MNHMTDSASKHWLRAAASKRDQLAVIAWCIVYVLVIAAIDWLTR